MSKTLKQRLMTLLRVAVCAGLLTLVLWGVKCDDTVITKDGKKYRSPQQTAEEVVVFDEAGARQSLPLAEVEQILPGLRTAIKQCDKQNLALYFLIFLPVPLIQSLRFQWLLRAQDIRISYWESLKLCYAGNFLNFTLIGTTGGDVFKAYYVCLHTDLKTEAVTTILLDRIVGLVGLVLMVAIVVLPIAYDRLPREIVYFMLIFLAGVVVGGLVFISKPVRAMAADLPVDRFPKLVYLQRMESATRRLLNHKGLLFWSLVLTVAIHFLVTTAVTYAARALGMNYGDNWVDYYAYIASGNIIAAIPISFMGLGTMEFFYKTYFTEAHGTLEQIIILAMSVRLLLLFHSLPGALVTLTGAYRPKTVNPSELETASATPVVREG